MSNLQIIKEIIKPILIIIFISIFSSILKQHLNNFFLFNLSKSFDNIIQIGTFLISLILSVLALRLAPIDYELRKIVEKMNSVFEKYGYYGHLLNENQIDTRILEFYNIIENFNIEQKKHKKTELNKKKIEALREQYNSLKNYRHVHIQVVKPISIIILILIIICLFAKIIHIKVSYDIALIIKFSVFYMSIYIIYESISTIFYMYTNPFTNNDKIN